MTWDKKELSGREVRELANRAGVDLITASILLRRNLADSQALRFLVGEDSSNLHSPFLFRDMIPAVERVRRAVASGERILIFGDRDVDGITATVLLFEALQGREAQVSWMLPCGEEDYGLTSEAIGRIHEAGTRLLVTVDCGISNREEIAMAGRLGIEAIILDHHNPPENLPEAVAVIDPKADPGYPFKDLSGCGVALKLAWALEFSATPWYGRPVWLLNLRPENEVMQLEAVRLLNLTETDRIFETLPPSAAALRSGRLAARLASEPEARLFIHDLEAQKPLLERLGWTEDALRLEDLQPWLKEGFPALAGRSLLALREQETPIVRANCRDELDTLKSLFERLVRSEIEPSWQKTAGFMDLAALGTLADLMPIADENRAIVRQGLERINRLERSGLRELIVRQNLHGRRITATDVSWQINPVLNAAGRMGEPQSALNLLICPKDKEQDGKAGGLVERVLELNRRRRNLGDRLWDGCFRQARESFDRTGGRFVLIADPAIPRGITGILAARLVSFYKVPSLAVSVGEEKAVGSLRSPHPLDGFLLPFADLLTAFGGHDFAAGFTMPRSALEAFEQRFYRIVEGYKPPREQEEKLVIDAELPPAFLNPDLIRVVEFFAPYGEGNPPLVFLTRGAFIESMDAIGRTEAAHLKLLLRVGKFRWPAVYWKSAHRAGRDFQVQDQVDVAYRMGRNYFQNQESLQLTVLDLRKTQ